MRELQTPLELLCLSLLIEEGCEDRNLKDFQKLFPMLLRRLQETLPQFGEKCRRRSCRFRDFSDLCTPHSRQQATRGKQETEKNFLPEGLQLEKTCLPLQPLQQEGLCGSAW